MTETQMEAKENLVVSGNIGTLVRFLLETARPLLEKRLQFGLSAENLEQALQLHKNYLEKYLPPATFQRLYCEKGSTDTILRSVSIHEILLLTIAIPDLKNHFTQSEKDALKNLDNLLYDVYQLVIFENSGGNFDQSFYEQVRSKLLIALSELGLNVQDDMMEKHADKNDPGNGNHDAFQMAFLEQFAGDQLFRHEFAKRLNKIIQKKPGDAKKGEANNVFLQKELEIAKKARARGNLDLDSFSNLRKSLAETMTIHLTCGYCQQIFTDPKTLPCLHSFCASCLKRNLPSPVNTAPTGQTVPGSAEPNEASKVLCCPACKTRIGLSSEAQVDYLPRSLALDAYEKIYDSAKQADQEKASECDLCILSATRACFWCVGLYCENHAAALYHDHPGEVCQMVQLSALTKIDRSAHFLYAYCAQHKQHLARFCEGCKVPLCAHRMCIQWHTQHVTSETTGLREIEEVNLERCRHMKYLQNVMEKKAAMVESKIAAVERNQISVADVQENVRQSIDRYFSEVVDSLLKQKAVFLSDLDKASAQCFLNDEMIRGNLKNWLENHHQFSQTLQAYDLDAKDKDHMMSLSELSPLVQEAMLQVTDTCHGSLVAQTKRLSYPETRLRELQHFADTLKSNIQAVTATRYLESVVKFTPGITLNAIGLPVHFAVDGAQRLYIISRSGMVAVSRIYWYDLTASPRDGERTPIAFSHSGSRSFERLALDPVTRKLYVAEEVQSSIELPSMRMRYYICVRIYQPTSGSDTSPLARTIQVEHLTDYSNVSMKYVSGKLYLADSRCVCEVELPPDSTDCRLVRKFNFFNMTEITDFAVEPRRDALYVVDAKKHRLLLFDCSTQTVKTIGEQGVAPCQFEHPCAVAIDDYGHVFVADAGNLRIQIFDLNGKLVRVVPYAHNVTEKRDAIKTPGLVKVFLQVVEDVLYMYDTRSDQIWKYRYM